MNRPVVGLVGALVAGVAIALPSQTANTTAKVTVKQAVMKGGVVSSSARPEQMVSRLIVKLRDPAAGDLVRPMSAVQVQALSRTAGVGMKSVRAMAGSASLLALDTPLSLSEAKAAAARLARDPAVEYAEPDIMLKKLMVPGEARFDQWQWNLFAPSSTYTGELTGGGTRSASATGGANLPLAWDVTTGSNTVVIAIIDTGIVNHPDLNNSPAGDTYIPSGRFLPGYDFISSGVGAPTLPANFVANDGGGRDNDPSDPGDWVTTQEETAYASVCDDGQTGPQNSSWHGSHMSGVAAATWNNAVGANPAYGIGGIAPLARLLPVRALGKCGGQLSDISEAIRWAAGLSVPNVPMNTTPARVINLSLGSGPDQPCSATMQAAVNDAITAGATVVAATGNDGTIGLSSPAKCTGVIAVTAHTINGENADYANIDVGTSISAPGGGTPTSLGAGGPTDDPNWFGYYIWSTILFGNTSPSSADSQNRTGPAFAGFTGTSAATPQVAGVAALLTSIQPTASPLFIRSWVTAGGNVQPHPATGACAVFLINCGKGLLDAKRAVDAASNLIPAVSIAGANQVVLPGTNVALSGTATPYLPQTLASVAWTQESGTAVTLNGAATNSVSFTAPPSPTTVVLRFRATDNLGKVADDLVSIRSNRPPVLGAVPAAQTVNIGQPVNFTVTATDPDGEPVFFAATSIPEGATFSSAGVFNWDTTNVAPNTNATFTYLATDGISSSPTASVAITVGSVSQPQPPAPPPGGAPPPTGGGGGGGGALPFWQLLLLSALSLAARVRIGQRAD